MGRAALILLRAERTCEEVMQPLKPQGLLLLGVTVMSSVAAEVRTVPVGEWPLKSEGSHLRLHFPNLDHAYKGIVKHSTPLL